MRPRPFPLLLAIALLLPAASASAGEWDHPARAVVGDLEVRILPARGQGDADRRVPAGDPMEVRYEVRNRGSEPVLVPLRHPLFVVGKIRYISEEAQPFLGGRAWGPAPSRESLVEIAPGGAHVETLHLTPSMRGVARVRVDFASSHEKVLEYVPVRQQIGEGVFRNHHERKLVAEPRLWHGVLVVEAPLLVQHTSSYPPEATLDRLEVSRLWRHDMSTLDRLDLLGRMGTLDPSSRAVDTFRKAFAVRHDGPAWPTIVRHECAKQLAIAASRGYGFAGIKTLLAVAQDEEEDEGTRLVALEGLAVALDETLTTSHGDCTFRLTIFPAWHEQAVKVFTDLAAGQGALADRAKAILEARAKDA